MLRLALSLNAGRVRIACDPSHVSDLQSLRGRFYSSLTLGQGDFEVDLEDLLINLGELAAWPVEDADVQWEPALQALVLSNHHDARAVDAGLNLASVGNELIQPSLPPAWRAPLTQCQRRDLASLQRLSHGANFSVPGAGKTRVALAYLQHARAAGLLVRALVVCPKSAFESWYEEASLCGLEAPLRLAVMTGPTVPSGDLVLVNYERLPDARGALIAWLASQPALLVLDEAHRMKLGPQGAWGAACIALAPWAMRRLILTGTPAPNGAKDLENLMAFVWPGLGRSVVSQAMASDDLRAASRILKPLFVRTTKSELGLPPMTLSVRRLALPDLHRALYRALLGQASASLSPGERDLEKLGKVLLYLLMAATTPALLATGSSRYEPLPYRVPPLQPPVGSTLQDLMRDLPDYELAPKYQEVLTMVAENARLGRKTLVWSTFVRNLTSLALLLERFKPALVHGGTEDRVEQIRRFRSDPDCFVLLSNPATLGEGVSLHHVCHDAVYVDRDFAAGRFIQSLDRIHRLGLPPDIETRVTILMSAETVDEVVEQRLAQKVVFLGSILDDPAVLALADLDEEPTVSVGMDSADLGALIGHLRGDGGR